MYRYMYLHVIILQRKNERIYVFAAGGGNLVCSPSLTIWWCWLRSRTAKLTSLSNDNKTRMKSETAKSS